MIRNWRSIIIHDEIQIRVFEVFFIGEIVAETKIKSTERRRERKFIGEIMGLFGQKNPLYKICFAPVQKKSGRGHPLTPPYI